MVLTNEMGLPQTLVNTFSTERHNKPGEISATTLIKGAKSVILTDRHFDEIEIDIADNIKPLIGTAVHYFLEAKNPDAFTEEKFSVQVQDKVVTGQVDLYDMEEGVIYDYKTTSVWKVIYKSFDEWKKQGYIYAWLMKQSGLKVNKCVFVPMFTDWSKSDAERNADYPKKASMKVEFEVTDEGLAEIEEYIRQKVAEISKAETLPDDEIPECSAEETWQRPTIYAVMKKGRKTAVNAKQTDRAVAEKMAAEIEGGYVEERKGERVKCLSYCNCCQFCSYYKEHCQQKAEESAA